MWEQSYEVMNIMRHPAPAIRDDKVKLPNNTGSLLHVRQEYLHLPSALHVTVLGGELIREREKERSRGRRDMIVERIIGFYFIPSFMILSCLGTLQDFWISSFFTLFIIPYTTFHNLLSSPMYTSFV